MAQLRKEKGETRRSSKVFPIIWLLSNAHRTTPVGMVILSAASDSRNRFMVVYEDDDVFVHCMVTAFLFFVHV